MSDYDESGQAQFLKYVKNTYVLTRYHHAEEVENRLITTLFFATQLGPDDWTDYVFANLEEMQELGLISFYEDMFETSRPLISMAILLHKDDMAERYADEEDMGGGLTANTPSESELFNETVEDLENLGYSHEDAYRLANEETYGIKSEELGEGISYSKGAGFDETITLQCAQNIELSYHVGGDYLSMTFKDEKQHAQFAKLIKTVIPPSEMIQKRFGVMNTYYVDIAQGSTHARPLLAKLTSEGLIRWEQFTAFEDMVREYSRTPDSGKGLGG